MSPFAVTVAGLLGTVLALNVVMTVAIERLDPAQAIAVYKDVDDRRFQKARIEVMPRARVAVFGSSRILPLSTAAAGLPPGALFNAGVGAATVEDYIALWMRLRKQEKVPDVAVFSVDAWVVDWAQPPARWRSLAGDVTEFLDAHGRGSAELWSRSRQAVFLWERAKDLLSYSLLRVTIRDLRQVWRTRTAPDAGVAARLAEEDYGARWEGQGEEQVRRIAIEYARAGADGLRDFHLDRQRVEWLEALWRDMRAHQVTVLVYMPPYHPATWALLQADPRAAQALRSTHDALGDTARAAGVGFHDASDPARIPCAESEFYDGRHPKGVCLGRVVKRLLRESGLIE